VTHKPAITSSTVDDVEAATPDQSWTGLYKAGGWSAMLFVLLVLIPLVLVVAAPVPPVDGSGLLAYIAAHKVIYLTELICFVGLSVPALVAFAAVAVALKGVHKSLAALGGLFGVVSEAIALALGSSPSPCTAGWLFSATHTCLPTSPANGSAWSVRRRRSLPPPTRCPGPGS